MWCLRVFFVCLGVCLAIAIADKSYSVTVGDQTAAPAAVMDYSTGADLRIKIGVFVNMPAAPTAGSMYRVSDAINAEDCTTGGGSKQSLCIYSGAVWYPVVEQGEIQKVADIITLTGRNANDTHLGYFTGSTISDNDVIQVALQELETAVETAHGTPTTFTIYTSDDCALVSGSAGDLCFEY